MPRPKQTLEDKKKSEEKKRERRREYMRNYRQKKKHQNLAVQRSQNQIDKNHSSAVLNSEEIYFSTQIATNNIHSNDHDVNAINNFGETININLNNFSMISQVLSQSTSENNPIIDSSVILEDVDIVENVNDSENFNDIPRPFHENILEIPVHNVPQLPIPTEHVEAHYLGNMDVECHHCGAKHFSSEETSNNKNSFNDCCNHGNIVLPDFNDFPDELRALFEYNHYKSKDFFTRIRVYNNMFAFASFKANMVNFTNRRPGPYCFKILGQLYYKINTALLPTQDKPPRFGQLFIYDSRESLEYRKSFGEDLDEYVLEVIDKIMREHNIFAQSYAMAGEIIKQLDNVQEFTLAFSLKNNVDKNRFNLPRVDEVAAVFSTNDRGVIPDSYVVIRCKDSDELISVSWMDPNVEPWLYPLFYPRGEQGWHENILKIGKNEQNDRNDQDERKNRVTRSEYVKYRIAIRDQFNSFIRGGRLFQQWLVDFCVKI